MTIVCHSRQFIFLRTRKTAGSSIELWLSEHLDPGVDLIAPGHELRTEHSDLAAQFGRVVRPTRRIANRIRGRPWWIRQHMPAYDVRLVIGENAWRRYRKITVVRNPWDRFISFWRWRQHRWGIDIALNDFIAAIESGNGDQLAQCKARNWDNWPIYTIGDEIVANDVIRFEDLLNNLARVFENVGISCRELPRAKAHIRQKVDTTNIFTPELIDRIAKLYEPEIEAFGYEPPNSIERLNQSGDKVPH